MNAKTLLAGLLSLGLLQSSVQPLSAAVTRSAAPKPVSLPGAPRVPAAQALPAVSVSAASLPAAHAQLAASAARVAQPAALADGTAARALDSLYNGAPQLASDNSVTASASPAAPGPRLAAPAAGGSGLSAASTRAPAPAPRRARESGKANVTVIAVIGGVVLAVALAIGWFWHDGNKREQQLVNSKSYQTIIAIEKADREENLPELIKLTQSAQERRERMQERLADARSRGDKKIATGETVKDAEFFEALDGLAAARGQLAVNRRSQEPAQRIGEVLPHLWLARLQDAEAEARRTGREGALALELQALKAELDRQESRARGIDKDLAGFDEKVPSFFAGRMKEMSARGRKDAEHFRHGELGVERQAYERARSEMRARVAEKLSASPEFRAERERMERLRGASEGTLGAAVGIARDVEKSLNKMAEARRLELHYLKLASDHERDAQRAGDVSQWRAWAAQQAAERQAAAAAARGQLEALARLIPVLQNDPVLKQEQLTFALQSLVPRGPNAASWDVIVTFWLGPDWNIFMKLFSPDEAFKLSGAFGRVLGGLESVQAEVHTRLKDQTATVDAAIDAELQKQINPR